MLHRLSESEENPAFTEGPLVPNPDEDFWDALLPDDDHEPLPERGDFWVEQDELFESP